MNQILNTAIKAAIEGGKIVSSFFKNKYEVSMKGIENPVTEADIAVDNKLKEILMHDFPNYGWLSEETKDTKDRLKKDRVWVVDPIDGTKEFVEGIPNFAISIGLVEKGIPILGVIYNPISKDLFTGYENGTYLNKKPTQLSNSTDFQNMVMLNSRSETKKGLWKPYEHQFKKLIPVGSIALKLAMIATGKADIVASLRPKNEWDLCAGHCLINSSGGQLLTTEGQKISYNKPKTLIKPGLVAGNKIVVKKFLNMINV